MTSSGTGSLAREVVLEAMTKSRNRKSWLEVVAEDMTRSGSRSHKSYKEGVLEVITWSGTGTHDPKWYLKE